MRPKERALIEMEQRSRETQANHYGQPRRKASYAAQLIGDGGRIRQLDRSRRAEQRHSIDTVIASYKRHSREESCTQRGARSVCSSVVRTSALRRILLLRVGCSWRINAVWGVSRLLVVPRPLRIKRRRVAEVRKTGAGGLGCRGKSRWRGREARRVKGVTGV